MSFKLAAKGSLLAVRSGQQSCVSLVKDRKLNLKTEMNDLRQPLWQQAFVARKAKKEAKKAHNIIKPLEGKADKA